VFSVKITSCVRACGVPPSLSHGYVSISRLSLIPVLNGGKAPTERVVSFTLLPVYFITHLIGFIKGRHYRKDKSVSIHVFIPEITELTVIEFVTGEH
jgi:hypothetical protein